MQTFIEIVASCFNSLVVIDVEFDHCVHLTIYYFVQLNYIYGLFN